MFDIDTAFYLTNYIDCGTNRYVSLYLASTSIIINIFKHSENNPMYFTFKCISKEISRHLKMFS